MHSLVGGVYVQQQYNMQVSSCLNILKYILSWSSYENKIQIWLSIGIAFCFYTAVS